METIFTIFYWILGIVEVVELLRFGFWVIFGIANYTTFDCKKVWKILVNCVVLFAILVLLRMFVAPLVL